MTVVANPNAFGSNANANAAYQLGVIYDYGKIGVARDAKAAKEW